MQVNTNLNALNAANALNLANRQVTQASQRISTTQKINSAADDPGSMLVLNSLKSKIGSYAKVNDNIISGNGLLQTMNGALTSMVDLLNNLRTLAVAGASSTASASAQTAFSNYLSQIDSLANSTKWNGNSVLNNSGNLNIQTGINSGDQTSISFFNATTTGLGLSSTVISSQSDASNAITAIDSALSTISGYQTRVGASQNALSTYSSYNTSMSTTNKTAYSSLVGADIAQETANLAAAQIKQNSASAMLAQATQMDKEVVSTLLKQFIN